MKHGSFDLFNAIEKSAPKPAGKPVLLVVDDEAEMVELVSDVLYRSVDCTILTAPDLTAARDLMERNAIDLLVTDVKFPDGDGISLLAPFRRARPLAGAIVMTGAPSVEGAVSAIRYGEVDFLPKPFSSEHLVDRVKTALAHQQQLIRGEKRLDRLRSAVRKLNDARKSVGKKVDLLCNDLITAYGDLSRQFDTVRTQEGFRKFIGQSKDLEQLLCHTMDFLLRQIGYSNVGIYLASDEEGFQLGAYMKYTLAGEPKLADAIKAGMLTHVVREGLINLDARDARRRWSPAELPMLDGHGVLASNCTYLGENLAAVILFRDGKEPFKPEDAETLRAIGPIFAVALASVVKGSEHYDPERNPFSDDTVDESNAGEPEDRDDRNDRDDPKRLENDDEKKRKKKKEQHDADWWKRGEEPPF